MSVAGVQHARQLMSTCQSPDSKLSLYTRAHCGRPQTIMGRTIQTACGLAIRCSLKSDCRMQISDCLAYSASDFFCWHDKPMTCPCLIVFNVYYFVFWCLIVFCVLCFFCIWALVSHSLIGVGDGVAGARAPPQISGKIFLGQMSRKFGHFVNFSCIHFRAKIKCLACPQSWLSSYAYVVSADFCHLDYCNNAVNALWLCYCLWTEFSQTPIYLSCAIYLPGAVWRTERPPTD